MAFHQIANAGQPDQCSDAEALTSLASSAANFSPLSPLDFLKRSADFYPNEPAIIHSNRVFNYAEFYDRSRRLASALSRSGVCPGDVVSVMLPNVPAMLEAHFGVPMAGAVLNTINTRLDAETIAYILNHCGAKVLIVDAMYSEIVAVALNAVDHPILVIDNDDPLYKGSRQKLGEKEYETFINDGDPGFKWQLPDNESSPIALNYTSGTTGRPKGVLYHHRGAYLNAIANVIAWPIPRRPVYLWTLPMFHCNGWCYPWSITAMGGTHVCLRAIDHEAIFSLIVQHNVSHMCGAPTVLSMLINAPGAGTRKFNNPVALQTGGSPPPAKVIKAMENLGFCVTHIYGMTELHGISTFCEPRPEWAEWDTDRRASRMAQQGVNHALVVGQIVGNSDTCEPLPKDGKSIGEILIRGNTVMLGYLKDPVATADAFKGDWMHTGDLAVWHPDGYIEIKDRKKDIIISGGENISSVEVEIALQKHEAVALAAVVAKPDEKWGETPCAFVFLKEGAHVSESDLVNFCRDHIAHFKCPKNIVFGPLPITATGKIQKYVLRERAKQL